MAKDGDLRKAHSTPLIVSAAGKMQMLSAGAKAAYGYDPLTGRELWKVKYASPLLVDGLLYTAADESFVTCLEAATGKMVWTERIGGKYAASPIYADGRLYFFSQDGSTTVLKPGRALEVLATNSLANGFMASPAVDGKAFYLRTKTHLYRIEGKDGES